MVDIHAHPGGSLPIGRRGENLARRVIFDLAPWRKCYGDGTVQLLHQRAGDADPYPCALTVEGDTAYWLIRAADVDKPGWGDAQLHYYVGETLAKSSAWRTLTADALGAPGETPPEPQQDWVEKVLAAGTAAEDAAGRAEEAAVHPPYPSEETGTWWTWNAEAGKYEDTGLSYSGSGGGGTTDHTKLTNRNAENQHPMSAITGLVGALNGKVSVADIIDNLTTNVTNKPLSAAQGVALKALIDEITVPDKLPNPNALAFTGAVTVSYDGSAPVSVEIPSGSGSGSAENWRLVNTVTTTEDVADIRITQDSNGNPLSLKKVKIFAKVRGNSANLSTWCRITANNLTNNFYCDIQNTFAAKEGQDYYNYARADFAIYAGRLMLELLLRSGNNAASKNTLWWVNNSGCFENYPDVVDAITSIRMWSASAGIGAGTELMIYGVDA